jgi:phosphoserine aminotransferase
LHFSGNWSRLAAKEAENYGKVNLVLPESKKFIGAPPKKEWNFSPDASYVYYCDNETVYGNTQKYKFMQYLKKYD